ncbi:uncharacterized protein LOC131957132 [Physella acuta]|uniref:uncharacterized protein LOC131957132 n=1 Tax=Physella acuta TaxID=109671 RepID=UPI0027DB7296|nr:uncharacterized protein LOC131957132 [Physella acuta]
MVSVVALGVVCGFGVVAALFVGVLAVYLLCRRRSASAGNLPVDRSSYEAVGDYKPPSLLSVSSSQDLQISRESRTVQPKTSSMSTTSRSSMRSEQFTDDTSSISAKSDASVDSLIFDPNFEPRSRLQQNMLEPSTQAAD